MSDINNLRRKRRRAGKQEDAAADRSPTKGGGILGIPPIDSGPLPDDVLGGVFGKLDPELPLLLLPIRIETRFIFETDPPELRIRIYPDQIHINADRPQLDSLEQDLTKDFWKRWYGAKDASGRKAAWQWFVNKFGARRAGYLARHLQPTLEKNGVLTFPPTDDAQSANEPARPMLLPHQWLAIGYGVGGTQIFKKASRPVAHNLRTGPDPESPAYEVNGGGLQVDEGLAWMIDYERALEAGMAITIPLTGDAVQATDQVDVLLVVGVMKDMDPKAASADLAQLLGIHARTTGLAFVPQGTPTNNTESVSSGWTPAEVDTAAQVERILKDLDLPKGPLPAFNDNAAHLAKALGLSNADSLRRLPYGADPEAFQSEQMRVVLFEAVFGVMIRQLLDVGKAHATSTNAMNAVRAWFINHVTGGAPLPTLRVGDQPYGILPVRCAVAAPDLTTPAGQVERVISLMIDGWRQSTLFLPALSADPTASDKEVELETAIASILATQPHPARFFLRKMEEYVKGETALAIQITYDFILDVMEEALTSDEYGTAITVVANHYQEKLAELYPGGLQTVDDQIDLWDEIAQKVSQTYMGDTRSDALTFIGSVQSVIGNYEARQRPLRWVGLDRYEGVLGEENTRLIAGALYGSSAEWGSEGLIQATEAGPGSTAADYLAELKQRFAAREATGELARSTLSLSPKPLLYQFLEQTLSLVPNRSESNQSVLAALENLASLDPGKLEWLLRETLGLGAHRLDAWATSLASERLERLRSARPVGIQIGAFGWVTQLKPRRNRRPSEGFIHTPSMSHAATAALLRAGWLTHGSQDPLSPAAVNIDSRRVRDASWLLDGVRQGQPLGDLLGYRFERFLHDRWASDQIQPVRQLVLSAKGQPNASTNQPVDGIDLLELYRNGQLGALKAPVQRAIDDLEAAFDAVNDVGLFEAVHQTAAGNYERSAAMTDAISTGTISPPELRAPLTPRSAVSVEHRVVILLPPDGTLPDRGWQAGIRDQVAPALETWVSSLLPPAEEIGFQMVEIFPDGQIGQRISQTLAQLGLSALDAVYLVGDDPLNVSPALRTLAAGAAGMAGAVQIDPTLSSRTISLADFTVLATELRRLVETLRPLDARDLRPASARGEADVDLTEALSAVEALLLEAVSIGDHLDKAVAANHADEVALIVSRLAKMGISSGSTLLDSDRVVEVQNLVRGRIANVKAVEVDPTDHQPGLEMRLSTLLGRRVPVLGRFLLSGSADGAVVNAAAGPAHPVEVDDWLDAVSCVRDNVGRLTAVGMLSELMGAGGLTVSAGQDPLVAGEEWAAIHRPAGAGRLSVVAVSSPTGLPGVDQPACGLFVDQWSESIPSNKQVTGVTFQYDAPSNRPPQAWLLATTPDGESWSLKLVIDTLLQTLEWAMLRTVGPEDLVDYGRAIPAIYIPENIVNWPGKVES